MADKDTIMEEMFSQDAETEAEDTTNEVVESGSVEQADGSTVDASTPDDVIEELSAKEGDLSIDDLRKLPGADKHTDAELEAMWQAAVNPPKQRGYKVYNQEGEVADFEKLSAKEFLELQFGYNALGKEQKKGFDELIRNAQLGHFNESRLQKILSDRNGVYEKYTSLEKEHSEWGKDRKLWDYALGQYTQGNTDPLTQLIEAYKNIQSAPPSLTSEAPESAANEQAAAQQVYYEVVVPAAYKLSQAYKADPKEISAAIMQFVNNEPDEFMDAARLNEIINFELPQLLERNGYSVSGQAQTVQPNSEVAELRKKIAALEAGQKNGVVAAAKGRKAPPAGGGQVPSAGEVMPDIKTRQEMKDYLRT